MNKDCNDYALYDSFKTQIVMTVESMPICVKWPVIMLKLIFSTNFRKKKLCILSWTVYIYMYMCIYVCAETIRHVIHLCIELIVF